MITLYQHGHNVYSHMKNATYCVLTLLVTKSVNIRPTSMNVWEHKPKTYRACRWAHTNLPQM
mgnify:CR=1 FL=1